MGISFTDQVFGEDHMLYEELKFSYLITLSRYFLTFLYSYCFYDSVLWTYCYSIPLFICYHVWSFICYIVVILILHSDYIACSGYFRLSVYTWSFLLAYMRCRLLSRIHFHVFWEMGR